MDSIPLPHQLFRRTRGHPAIGLALRLLRLWLFAFAWSMDWVRHSDTGGSRCGTAHAWRKGGLGGCFSCMESGARAHKEDYDSLSWEADIQIDKTYLGLTFLSSARLPDTLHLLSTVPRQPTKTSLSFTFSAHCLLSSQQPHTTSSRPTSVQDHLNCHNTDQTIAQLPQP